MMKIAVLNGSPKGDQSVTMQYVHLIRKKFPQHELHILNIAQRINKLEKDRQAFQEVLEAIKTSDAVLWAFPLYILHVHGNYKRFIELIWERNAQKVFQGKYAATLTTSIKFYDHTAHNYIHAISDDLDMKYIGVYSAEMRDLLQEEERKRLLLFAENMFDTIEKTKPLFKQYQPVVSSRFAYRPERGKRNMAIGAQKIVVVADIEDEHSNLSKMVERFIQAFSGEIDVFRLNELDIKGGCLGCCQCGYDNTCVWSKRDGYQEWFQTKLMTADIIIYAGTIRDRYLSARWKTFFDRMFFHTHAPRLMNKQLGFLVSGPLGQNANLRQILEATAEKEYASLLGIVTDECGDSDTLDTMIQQFAEHALWCAEKSYVRPKNFLHIGGQKIFRDEMWGHLRVVFQADHRFYKERGIYDDFPQKDYKTRVLNLIGAVVMKLQAFRERFYKKEMKPGMIRGLQKIVEQS